MQKNQFLTGCVVFAGLSFGQSHVVLAGVSGSMNGLGVGKVNANVTSATLVPAATSDVNPPGQTQVLGAAVQGAPAPGGFDFKFLPSGSTAGTTAYIQGEPNYKWTLVSSASGNDKTDNQTIEALMDVTPAPFAYLSFDSELISPDVLKVHGIATDGTVILVQFFQDGSQSTSGFSTLAEGEDNTLPDPLPIIGKGQPLAGGQIPEGSEFTFLITLPDIPRDQLIMQVDALASSIAPDAGSLGLAFGLTVAGMAWARRRVELSKASA